jgi:signal transduction histidine kinase
MSIRLRLSLLYSAILTLALLAFGGLIYLRQAQQTLGIEERLLTGPSERFADGRRHAPDEEPPGRPLDDLEGGPPGFDSSQQQDEYAGGYFVRLSPDGQEILSSRTPDVEVLPISDDALGAVRSGEAWLETVTIEGERFLIHTVPIVADGAITEIVQMGRSLAGRDASMNALAINLLIAGAIAIVVAFGLGWALAGMSLRPIHRLTQSAQTIGAERDFSRRVEHTGPDDEVGQLAKTLNAMLSELQAAYQQVEESLEMQRRFVADVSHELRTPLTTLSGNVELLRREPPISTEDRSEVLADMGSESKRLIRLVNDLLALARADARRPLQSEPVAIRPIVEEACRQARHLAPDREITCDAAPDVAAMGQADAIKQVLLILLDNATRHADGPLSVSGKVMNGCVTVSVRDCGPGIDRETLPHIFERFSQGRPTGDGRGTGLGLAIAKALVEAQGGSITVESRVGEATTFIVTLPQAPALRATQST